MLINIFFCITKEIYPYVSAKLFGVFFIFFQQKQEVLLSHLQIHAVWSITIGGLYVMSPFTWRNSFY